MDSRWSFDDLAMRQPVLVPFMNFPCTAMPWTWKHNDMQVRSQTERRLCNRRALFATFLTVLVSSLALPSVHGSQTGSDGCKAASNWTAEDVIATHDQNNDDTPRKFQDLTVLGFVTPWNAGGKDVAVRQASRGRLDDVSPVTWQMHPDGLAGGHDFDETFYADLSKAGARIYPRILFEAHKWSLDDFRELSDDPSPMVARITQICSRGGFQGVVLEIWQALLATGALSGKEKDKFIMLAMALGENLRKDANLRTVLVLPPYSSRKSAGQVNSSDIAKLKIAFNFFVVMTYDFSVPGSRPGPMAPTAWVRAVATYLAKECGLGEKLLVGFNFYGLDFLKSSPKGAASNDRHIVGHELIALLKEHRPQLVWVDDVGEHAFVYQKEEEQHIVFYPSSPSIAQRIALLRDVGCGGIAIWELGQGLDYFFDEF